MRGAKRPLSFRGSCLACGASLDEARRNLAAALRDGAETNLLKGEPLSIPDSTLTDQDADIEEPIYLVLQTGQQIATTVGTGAP